MLDTLNDTDEELIRFAWELENTKDISTIAANMIEQSMNVVVIGYTFPLYNRLIDSKYINGKTLHGKLVIIQDPNAIQLTEEVLEFFPVEQYLRKLVTKTGCNNFFVLNDIFENW